MKAFLEELLLYITLGTDPDTCELEETIGDKDFILEVFQTALVKITVSRYCFILYRFFLDHIGEFEYPLLDYVLKFVFSKELATFSDSYVTLVQSLPESVKSKLADMLVELRVNYSWLYHLPCTFGSAVLQNKLPKFSIENGQRLVEIQKFELVKAMLAYAQSYPLQSIKKDFYTFLSYHDASLLLFKQNIFRFMLFTYLQLEAKRIPPGSFLFKYLVKLYGASVADKKQIVTTFYEVFSHSAAFYVLKALDPEAEYLQYLEFDFPELTSGVLQNSTVYFSEQVLARLEGSEKQVYQLLFSAFNARYSFEFDFTALEIVGQLSEVYRQYVLLYRFSNVYRIYANNILSFCVPPRLERILEPLKNFCILISKLQMVYQPQLSLVQKVAYSEICYELKYVAFDLIVQNCKADPAYRMLYLQFGRISRLPAAQESFLAMENLILTINQTFFGNQSKALLQELYDKIRENPMNLPLLFGYLDQIELSVAYKSRILEYYLRVYEPERYFLLAELSRVCSNNAGAGYSSSQIISATFYYRYECDPIMRRILRPLEARVGSENATAQQVNGLCANQTQERVDFMETTGPIVYLLTACGNSVPDQLVYIFVHSCAMCIASATADMLDEYARGVLGFVKREEAVGALAGRYTTYDYTPVRSAAIRALHDLEYARPEWIDERSGQVLSLLRTALSARGADNSDAAMPGVKNRKAI